MSGHQHIFQPVKSKTKSAEEPEATDPSKPSRASQEARIHPVIIYPYKQPNDYSDLECLYQMIAQLDADKQAFARPITVMDRKTFYAMEGNSAFQAFRKGQVSQHSELLDVWGVDTCQMWYSGLGTAFERGGPNDVYWLIPGDFNYGSAIGKDVLGHLHDLPEIILELGQDLCIGEIATDRSNPKQLIDTYGTFALLYNWFPVEGREIHKVTERPRSEFFAIGHNFLHEVLQQRWYAYEQTVVILLQAFFSNKQISHFFVGDISDLPQGAETLASAMQQVERTERVLKSVWRERNQSRADWAQEYRDLERRSEQVRQTASVILQNLLG